ncbi:MAG TPA: chromosomal replication initiator protein DnaA [Candidatus Acidoferrales bacterium]|nr:chromosomal replication initiator protein DnaA [Candidatus Acidoferrales bacterium]
MATENVWQEALRELRKSIGEQNFDTWIKPVRARQGEPNELILEVPNKFFRDWLAENFLVTIRQTIAQLNRSPVQLSLVVNPQLRTSLNPEKARDAQEIKRPPRTTNLIAKYTFDNFVVGGSNQFAHAASLAVASQPGEHYNPFFIYGGVGLGKTHLVNAIGHRILERRPDLKVFYLSSESFMNELIASLRRDKMDDFKTRFRNIDVLILDDVQFLAGKERTQEEFFHTFNSLHETHRQIVITSDKFPKEIPELEDRLRNRFEWGLIADIQPPDMETRVAILEKKAELERVRLPHEVAIFLASHIDSNVRELEGSLTRLAAFASLTKAEITVELAQEVLQNTLKGRQREISVEHIQKAICDHFNLRVGDLKSKRRTKNIALPRQLAMYLCRKYTSTSFPAIGTMFGGRDHSTVIHASRTIEKKIKEDPAIRATVDRIEKSLKT